MPSSWFSPRPTFADVEVLQRAPFHISMNERSTPRCICSPAAAQNLVVGHDTASSVSFEEGLVLGDVLHTCPFHSSISVNWFAPAPRAPTAMQNVRCGHDTSTR